MDATTIDIIHTQSVSLKSYLGWAILRFQFNGVKAPTMTADRTLRMVAAVLVLAAMLGACACCPVRLETVTVYVNDGVRGPGDFGGRR